MNHKHITFIGAGNMATALIAGLIKNNYPAQKISATDPSSEKLLSLQQQWGITTFLSNQEGAAQAEMLVFAVKPQMMKSVTEEIAPVVSKQNPLIISIAAGVKETSIARWLNHPAAIIRAMPNTPALIGAGATALYANAHVTSEQTQDAEHLLRTVGLTVWLNNEKDLDIVTGLSGSGPAYFFYMMEALEKTAIDAGLSEEIAHTLTLQTALGAARLALQSDETLSTLRDRITSRGGTTEAALNTLEMNNVSTHFKTALLAAMQRAEALGEEFGKAH